METIIDQLDSKAQVERDPSPKRDKFCGWAFTITHRGEE